MHKRLIDVLRTPWELPCKFDSVVRTIKNESLLVPEME